MPYVSDAQRRWAHSPSGISALGKSGVKEWDKATAGKNLPERVSEKKSSLGSLALASLPSLAGVGIGGTLGAINAPKGYGVEGFGRGAYQGGSTASGAVAGAGLGGLAGALAGGGGAHALGASDKAQLLAALIGGVGLGIPGAIGGGYLGNRMGKGVTGTPVWEGKEEQKKKRTKKASGACCKEAPRYSKTEKMKKTAQYRAYNHMANYAIAYNDQALAKAASCVLHDRPIVQALAESYRGASRDLVNRYAVKVAMSSCAPASRGGSSQSAKINSGSMQGPLSSASSMFEKLGFDAKARVLANPTINPQIKLAFVQTLTPFEKQAFIGALLRGLLRGGGRMLGRTGGAMQRLGGGAARTIGRGVNSMANPAYRKTMLDLAKLEGRALRPESPVGQWAIKQPLTAMQHGVKGIGEYMSKGLPGLPAKATQAVHPMAAGMSQAAKTTSQAVHPMAAGMSQAAQPMAQAAAKPQSWAAFANQARRQGTQFASPEEGMRAFMAQGGTMPTNLGKATARMGTPAAKATRAVPRKQVIHGGMPTQSMVPPKVNMAAQPNMM